MALGFALGVAFTISTGLAMLALAVASATSETVSEEDEYR